LNHDGRVNNITSLGGSAARSRAAAVDGGAWSDQTTGVCETERASGVERQATRFYETKPTAKMAAIKPKSIRELRTLSRNFERAKNEPGARRRRCSSRTGCCSGFRPAHRLAGADMFRWFGAVRATAIVVILEQRAIDIRKCAGQAASEKGISFRPIVQRTYGLPHRWRTRDARFEQHSPHSAEDQP
jgi:hypothetical protein